MYVGERKREIGREGGERERERERKRETHYVYVIHVC